MAVSHTRSSNERTDKRHIVQCGSCSQGQAETETHFLLTLTLITHTVWLLSVGPLLVCPCTNGSQLTQLTLPARVSVAVTLMGLGLPAPRTVTAGLQGSKAHSSTHRGQNHSTQRCRVLPCCTTSCAPNARSVVHLNCWYAVRRHHKAAEANLYNPCLHYCCKGEAVSLRRRLFYARRVLGKGLLAPVVSSVLRASAAVSDE